MTTPARLVIDIECTGFSAKTAHVIEFGAALIEPGGRVQRPVGMLIRPPRRGLLFTRSAKLAQRTHRIRPDDVWRQGMALSEAADRVGAYIDRITERYGGLPQIWATTRPSNRSS